MAVAAAYHPDPAITVDSSVARVIAVMPGGPSWNDGVRPGQAVVELTPGERPSDWTVVVTDGRLHYSSPASSHVFALRQSLPGAIVALVTAFIAVVSVRRAAAFGTAFAVVSIVLASHPLSLSGDRLLSTGAMVVAALVGVGWISAWRLGAAPVRASLTVAGAGVVLVWLYARFAQPTWYDVAETGRVLLIVASVAAVVMLGAPWRLWLRDQPLAAGRAVDIAVVAVTIVGIVFGSLVFALPVVVSVGLFAALLVTYRAVGRAAVGPLDRVFFSELRERAALAGVEEERTRLAADIHDVPLQELAGVIHRLEARGVTEEADMLRGVTAHLRAVTTELRPPVLDDLGLGPALMFVVDQANSAAPPTVVYSVTDRTGIEAERRLPSDVEVAVFRIVQEALTNAREHSGAGTVSVEGELAPDLISISVRDDGAGIAADARRSARERGRFGLAAMAARARAIDAALAVASEQPRGTRVSLLWRPP